MIQYANNIESTLAAGITDTDLSLSVETGDGNLFPSLSSPDVFLVTLISDTGIEIVKVTARSTDTFTCVRAQEGTTAKAFSLGDKVQMLITAGHFEDLRDNQLKRGSSILSSIVPNNNGELVFEATSNTAITIKYKGSDGIVRSGIITLS